MKKIISILLLLALTLSMSACSFLTGEDKEIMEEIQEALDEFKDDVINNANREKQPFSYKMAKVYEKPYNEEDYYKTELTYVIEFQAQGYHALDFAVYDNDNNLLTDSVDSPCDVNIALGGVCIDDDIRHADNISVFGGGFDVLDVDHYLQYIVKVYSKENAYSFDDLTLKSNLYYDLNPESQEEVTYEINAELSDITTKQPYLHSNSIVNFDGVYFVYDSNAGSGSGSTYDKEKDDYVTDFVYSVYEMEALMQETISDFSGKKEFVDENGQPMTAPEGFQFHIEFEEDENEQIQYKIGLKKVGEKEFDEEIREIEHSVYLKYTDLEGYTFILFGV